MSAIGDWFRDLAGIGSGEARRYHERLDRPREYRARVLAVLTLVAGAVYLVWLVGALDPGHTALGVAFYGAEAFAWLLFLVASLDFWSLRFKRPTGLEVEKKYDVDVFVPTAGEPFSVVGPVLFAVSRIRWPHGRLEVYVLDDGGAPQVELLAGLFGFHYLSRAQRDDLAQGNAKAGNLNFGLEHSDGDLILVMDADQVPEPDILERLVGYMRFDDLAFIQSRQRYLVPEGDPFNNLDPVFYEAAQYGFDDKNTVISCGSGVVYRRKALEDIGGFATWNLVEDLTTSYELHSRGWKSFYFPFALSFGLAPDDMRGVYNQRGQWALDTMRLFFWDNPFLKSGLDWSKRLSYLVIGLTYVAAGFTIPFFFSIPVWTYLTGETVLTAPEWQFFLLRVVYFVAMVAALRYMFRGRNAGKQFQFLAGLFPIYLTGTVQALFSPPKEDLEYTPNNIGAVGQEGGHPLGVLWPQALLIAAHAVLPFVSLGLGLAAPRIVAANALVSAFVLWTLWPVVANSLHVHRVKTESPVQGEEWPLDELIEELGLSRQDVDVSVA